MNYYRRRFYNKEALEHIREYEELSQRLGPVVDDIKEAFFQLEKINLQQIFNKYRTMYGNSAYEYLQIAYPKWKNGVVKLSGQNAKRLLNLVPPFLTTKQRISMIERLCQYHIEKKYKKIVINVDFPSQGIKELNEVSSEFSQFPFLKYLPNHVLETVKWLNDSDIVTARTLLSEIDKRKNQISLKYADSEVKKIINLLQISNNFEATQEINLIGGIIKIEFYKPKKTLFQSIKSLFN